MYEKRWENIDSCGKWMMGVHRFCFVLFLIEMKRNKGQYLTEEIQHWFYDYAPCGVGRPGGQWVTVTQKYMVTAR